MAEGGESDTGVPPDVVQSDYQCGFCLSDVSEPRALPCAHIFCTACIEQNFNPLTSTTQCKICKWVKIYLSLFDSSIIIYIKCSQFASLICIVEWFTVLNYIKCMILIWYSIFYWKLAVMCDAESFDQWERLVRSSKCNIIIPDNMCTRRRSMHLSMR